MPQTMLISTNSFGFLLDGNWINEGEPLEVRSPYDGTLIATTFRPAREHLERAICAATRAFEITRKLPGDRKSVV